MFIGNEHILVKIEAADFEKNIIEGGVKNEESYNSNR